MSDTPKNEHAAALARLGRGIKKTMSAAAIRQRKKAAKKPRKKKSHDTARETN
jgi:hypothetical protein